MARLSREELYALVWDRPMTRLAKEFGLSDVALHKICRKNDIPTPPLGYWAKKAHGKTVRNTPLPEKADAAESNGILIHEGARSRESEAAIEARASVREAISAAPGISGDVSDTICTRTLARLSEAKADRSGIVTIKGKSLVAISVRDATVARTREVLSALVEGASRPPRFRV